GRLAAKIPAAAAEFRAGPDDAIHEVLLHFGGAFLAKSLDGSGHFLFLDTLNFCVVFVCAGELVDVAFAPDGFESKPAFAVIATTSVRPLLVESLKFSDFVRFDLDDEYVQIVALSLDRERCGQAEGYGEGPSGFAERHVNLLRIVTAGEGNLLGGLYTRENTGSISSGAWVGQKQEVVQLV